MATYGELSAYDPTLHAGKFLVVLHRDQNTDVPIETGYMPLGTMFTGVNAGEQFPPIIGAQALVIFVDGNVDLPVGAVFLSNAVEYPPFPDGKTRGWKDAKANVIKTTDDGASPGDGLGGARVVGHGYASVIAPHIELGTAEGLGASQGVMTKADGQALANAIISVVQTALNTLAGGCESWTTGGEGSPATAPTVGSVTAGGSTTVKATD